MRRSDRPATATPSGGRARPHRERRRTSPSPSRQAPAPARASAKTMRAPTRGRRLLEARAEPSLTLANREVIVRPCAMRAPRTFSAHGRGGRAHRRRAPDRTAPRSASAARRARAACPRARGRGGCAADRLRSACRHGGCRCARRAAPARCVLAAAISTSASGLPATRTIEPSSSTRPSPSLSASPAADRAETWCRRSPVRTDAAAMPLVGIEHDVVDGGGRHPQAAGKHRWRRARAHRSRSRWLRDRAPLCVSGIFRTSAKR